MVHQGTEGSATVRRWPWAAFPVISIALLAVGGGLMPTGLDQPITSRHTALTELATAAAHAQRVYVATTVILLGLGALAVAFFVIAELASGGAGAASARWGAGIGVAACFCGVVTNVLANLDLAAAAESPAPRIASAHVLTSANTAPIAEAFLVGYLAGLVLGSALLGFGLWRSHATARWVAAGFPLGVVIGGLAPPGPLNVLLSLPLAAVMVMLTLQLRRGGRANADPSPPVAPLAAP